VKARVFDPSFSEASDNRLGDKVRLKVIAVGFTKNQIQVGAVALCEKLAVLSLLLPSKL